MTGSIPEQISKLTALQQLNFRTNKLIGSIPDGISILTALQYLDLGLNRLSGLDFKTEEIDFLEFCYESRHNTF